MTNYSCYVKEVENLASGLIEKLTNFLMPVEDGEEMPAVENVGASDRRAQFKVHSQAALKVYIAAPQAFDDVKICADCLKANVAVLINYESVDANTQQRIADFLNGVCFVIGGDNQRVSDMVMIYAPGNVDLSKELYAYSVPAYVKRK
jgi:cell division inhibitor SepF